MPASRPAASAFSWLRPLVLPAEPYPRPAPYPVGHTRLPASRPAASAFSWLRPLAPPAASPGPCASQSAAQNTPGAAVAACGMQPWLPGANAVTAPGNLRGAPGERWAGSWTRASLFSATPPGTLCLSQARPAACTLYARRPAADPGCRLLPAMAAGRRTAARWRQARRSAGTRGPPRPGTPPSRALPAVRRRPPLGRRAAHRCRAGARLRRRHAACSGSPASPC